MRALLLRTVARWARFKHCLYELTRLRHWDKAGHCAITLSRGYLTVALGCTCGRTFWALDKEAVDDLHWPGWEPVLRR